MSPTVMWINRGSPGSCCYVHLHQLRGPLRGPLRGSHEVPAWVEDLRVASPGAAEPTERLGDVFFPQNRVLLKSVETMIDNDRSYPETVGD